MHPRAILTVVLLASGGLALTAAGCGGGEQSVTFSINDLPRIVGPPPSAPKGISYYQDRQDPSAFTLDELTQRSERTWQKNDLKELEKAGFEQGYDKWWHSDRDVNAEARAFLLANATGARNVLDVLRRRVRADAENDGYTLARIPSSGLGNESWGFDAEDLFIYGWRHSNVVVVADLYCDEGSCEAGVRRAARAYAAAIDARMRRD